MDLHPNLVPDAVKLTAVKLIKESAERSEPPPQTYREAAEIIAYCMVGAEGFAAANAPEIAARVEQRVGAALDHGASLDARLVLLTLYARVIQPSVIDYFQLESSAD